MTHLITDYAESVVSTDLSREPYKELVPQRSPIGFPLGYVRERVEIVCQCGMIAEYSRLLVVERSSSKGRKIRPCGMSETVYDLEIAEIKVRGGTPRCDACIDLTPREAVPVVRPLGTKVGHSRSASEELNFEDFKNVDIGDNE